MAYEHKIVRHKGEGNAYVSHLGKASKSKALKKKTNLGEDQGDKNWLGKSKHKNRGEDQGDKHWME